MKNRILPIRQLVAPLLSICLVATGCGLKAETTVSSESFSGQTLYQGLFFAEGAVAKLFPEFWDVSDLDIALEQVPEDELAKIRAVREKVIAEIERADSGFFSRFSSEIQSGNPIVVRTALESAYDQTRAAADIVFPHDKADSSLEAQICGPTFCGLAVAMAVVIVNYVAIVHSLYRELAIRADIGVTKNVMSNSVGLGTNAITQDMAVAMVAKRLALE